MTQETTGAPEPSCFVCDGVVPCATHGDPGPIGAPETPVKHCRTCRCGAPRRKRSGGGITRTSADAKWSVLIRERAENRCQFIDPDDLPRSKNAASFAYELRFAYACNKQPAPGGLHAAHCFPRRCAVCTGSRGGWKKPHVCTRLDPDNGLAMCWPHHREIDGDKSLRYAVFTWWLGQDRFDALAARARGKRDR